MKRTTRVLVLTDHSVHSDQNSIYTILRQMILNSKCHSIYVASRGLNINDSFFKNMSPLSLYGCQIDDTFKYSQNGDLFKHSLKQLHPVDFDLVFLRLPRPVSDQFLLWINELFGHAIIINQPAGIIKTSNKKFLLNFPELCPDIRICHSLEDINTTIEKYPIVLKPLREYGGKGILKIERDQLDDGIKIHNTDTYLKSIEEKIIKEGYLAMKFLKNVTQGDKRILVAGGEVLAASLRLPKEDSWLCNVSQGGKSMSAEVNKEELEIIASINPLLKKEGILIYGVDTLVNDQGERVLSEINTLSIGGWPQAQAQTGKPIIKQLVDKIFEYEDVRQN